MYDLLFYRFMTLYCNPSRIKLHYAGSAIVMISGLPLLNLLAILLMIDYNLIHGNGIIFKGIFFILLAINIFAFMLNHRYLRVRDKFIDESKRRKIIGKILVVIYTISTFILLIVSF
jgi:hypothetical protein